MLHRTPLRSRPVLAEEVQDFVPIPVVMAPRPEPAGSLRVQPEPAGSMRVQPPRPLGSMRVPVQNACSFVGPPPQINSFHLSANLTTSQSFVGPAARPGQVIATVGSTSAHCEQVYVNPMSARRQQSYPEVSAPPAAECLQNGFSTPMVPMNVAAMLLSASTRVMSHMPVPSGVGTYEGPGEWRPVSHAPSNNVRPSASVERSMRPAGYVLSNNMRQSSVQRLPSFGNVNGSYSIASAARVAVGYPGCPKQQPQQQFQTPWNLAAMPVRAAPPSPQFTSTMRGVPMRTTNPYGGSMNLPPPAESSMQPHCFVDARPTVP